MRASIGRPEVDVRSKSAARAERPTTDDDEVKALFEEFVLTRSRHLRNELVERHSWLAHVCARQMAHRGEPVDDLVQVATIGILKAVERFDPSYGVSFKTYASVTALGELRRHFRDTTWRVRVPRRLQELHLNINHAIDHLTGELQRSPTAGEIAKFLDVTVDDVLAGIDAGTSYRTVPLLPVMDSGPGDDDALEGSTLTELDSGLDRLVDEADIARLLARLRPRERTIVYLRFYRNMTQLAIAEELGLSQVHISRILRSALDRLRDLSDS
jgi:RNA polymerase sigma-B factor